MTEERVSERINEIKDQLNQKIMENENYQQELHNLRQKLKACLATQTDLTLAHESMEEKLTQQEVSMEIKTNLLQERFSAEKKIYEERISELEVNLSCEQDKTKELRESVITKEKLLDILRNEKPDKTQENITLKEKIKCLINDLESKEQIEWEFLSKQQQLEEANQTLQKNFNEINDILQVKKADLNLLNLTLESTREELVICRSELESLKAVPARDSTKGNSLFAEVEDNRRKLIDDMTSLKKKYQFMKRNYDGKEKEIRVLRAEKAALLTKLQHESMATVDQSAHLIEMYKSRISELENRLKIEEKERKTKDKNQDQQVENSFSYLQSLLTAKKKEIEELCNKLEVNSTEKIVHEEMKYEIEKQLRKWQYKAMSYQAQLIAIENEPKCEECSKLKLQNYGDASLLMNTKQQDRQSTESSTPNLSIYRLDSTLERLLVIPTALPEEPNKSMDDTIIAVSHCSEENNLTAQLEDSTEMEETVPVANFISQRDPNFENESDKENITSALIANKTILKSALVKSEGKSEEKSQRSLRFTADTVDTQKPKPTRSKIEKKSYPMVLISSNQLKK